MHFMFRNDYWGRSRSGLQVPSCDEFLRAIEGNVMMGRQRNLRKGKSIAWYSLSFPAEQAVFQTAMLHPEFRTCHQVGVEGALL